MSDKNIVLITGVNGQAGSYMAEYLLEKGYEVHGIIRRASTFNTSRLDKIYKDSHILFYLHYGDVTDPISVDTIVKNVNPYYIIHFAAQSHVKVSFEVPAYTAQVDAFGTLNMLEAMKKHVPNARFYNAATSELYGNTSIVPQNETTSFNPQSPYAAAKLYAYTITKIYREAYGLYAVNGILFNNESERRGSTFVTAKIVNGFYDYITSGITFYLGNINAQRDWGYAPNYVKGIWLMLQQDKPSDYVLATNETHSIKEFINETIFQFNQNMNTSKDSLINNLMKKEYQRFESRFVWKLDKENREILWDTLNDKLVIGIDSKYYREAEVNLLMGDYSKAKKELGWEPKVKFKELVKIMVSHRINVGKI